jgi:F-type H+-transporting ATPase subunit b
MSMLAVLAAEGGFESPNKWLPENAEIIYGTIAFVVVAALLIKFAGPAITKSMAGRTARIQADLDRSVAARAAAETEATKVTSDLAGVDTEVAAIVAEARSSAEQLKIDGLARIEAELAESRAKALADIESSKSRVVTELEGSVGRLAIGAAEQVVENSLDADTQNQLIERFIDQVGGLTK